MTAVFAPSLGRLVVAAARRPPIDLWADPAELARFTLDLARRAGATHVLFPFDLAVLPEAAGALVVWEKGEPVVTGGEVDLDSTDPDDAADRGRWGAAVQASRFIGALHPVAAHVPSPARLIALAGAAEDDHDQLAAAEDLCAVYARALLETGGRVLLVDADPGEDVTGLERVAELFGVDCVPVGTGAPGVARVGAVVPDGTRVVLSDGPLAPDADLGAVAKLGETVARR